VFSRNALYKSTFYLLTYLLGKENKKKGKKDSGKLAIRPDYPRRHIEVKFSCRVASGV